MKDIKKELKEHYDAESSNWLADTTKDPVKYYYESYFRNIFRKKLTGDKALDMGCGGGTFTFKLAKHNFKTIYALDFSKNMIVFLTNEAKKRGIKNIKGVVSDVEKMPFTDNFFDYIVLVGVMECVKDKEKLLAEIKRVLKPGGVVSLRWLNRGGIWGFTEYIRQKIRINASPITYQHLSTVKESFSAIKNQGFRIKYFNGMLILPLYLFPFPISFILETLFIRTKISYMLEGLFGNRKWFVSNFYYSFCTELVK